jgi:hypothetical protein
MCIRDSPNTTTARSCALIHRHRPDLLDYDSLSKSQASAAENLTKAFSVAAEHLGIPVSFSFLPFRYFFAFVPCKDVRA